MFPQAITMAQAFDRDMIHDVARAISDEARAKYEDAKRNGEGIYSHFFCFYFLFFVGLFCV